jgi:hypothetical protein
MRFCPWSIVKTKANTQILVNSGGHNHKGKKSKGNTIALQSMGKIIKSYQFIKSSHNWINISER